MRRWFFAFLFAAAATLLALGSPETAAGSVETGPAQHTVELIIFHGEGCPHCARMLAFLDDLEARVPELTVVRYEVWYDQANQVIFRDTLARLDTKGLPASVPTRDHELALVIGIDETDEIAEHDAMLVTEP